VTVKYVRETPYDKLSGGLTDKNAWHREGYLAAMDGPEVVALVRLLRLADRLGCLAGKFSSVGIAEILASWEVTDA